jgi:hypothetical protein
MTTITIPEVTLMINAASIGTSPSLSTSGSILTLFVNGVFQTTSSSFGLYNNTFQLTGSDLSSSIANLDTLVETKVKSALGL